MACLLVLFDLLSELLSCIIQPFCEYFLSFCDSSDGRTSCLEPNFSALVSFSPGRATTSNMPWSWSPSVNLGNTLAWSMALPSVPCHQQLRKLMVTSALYGSACYLPEICLSAAAPHDSWEFFGTWLQVILLSTPGVCFMRFLEVVQKG